MPTMRLPPLADYANYSRPDRTVETASGSGFCVAKRDGWERKVGAKKKHRPPEIIDEIAGSLAEENCTIQNSPSRKSLDLSSPVRNDATHIKIIGSRFFFGYLVDRNSRFCNF